MNESEIKECKRATVIAFIASYNVCEIYGKTQSEDFKKNLDKRVDIIFNHLNENEYELIPAAIHFLREKIYTIPTLKHIRDVIRGCKEYNYDYYKYLQNKRKNNELDFAEKEILNEYNKHYTELIERPKKEFENFCNSFPSHREEIEKNTNILEIGK